jgi:hypothetical protein
MSTHHTRLLASMVLYHSCDIRKRAEELSRHGTYKTGKSCLYVKRLSDIAMTLPDEMCATTLAEYA